MFAPKLTQKTSSQLIPRRRKHIFSLPILQKHFHNVKESSGTHGKVSWGTDTEQQREQDLNENHNKQVDHSRKILLQKVLEETAQRNVVFSQAHQPTAKFPEISRESTSSINKPVAVCHNLFLPSWFFSSQTVFLVAISLSCNFTVFGIWHCLRFPSCVVWGTWELQRRQIWTESPRSVFVVVLLFITLICGQPCWNIAMLGKIRWFEKAL